MKTRERGVVLSQFMEIQDQETINQLNNFLAQNHMENIKKAKVKKIGAQLHISILLVVSSNTWQEPIKKLRNIATAGHNLLKDSLFTTTATVSLQVMEAHDLKQDHGPLIFCRNFFGFLIIAEQNLLKKRLRHVSHSQPFQSLLDSASAGWSNVITHQHHGLKV